LRCLKFVVNVSEGPGVSRAIRMAFAAALAAAFNAARDKLF